MKAGPWVAPRVWRCYTDSARIKTWKDRDATPREERAARGRRPGHRMSGRRVRAERQRRGHHVLAQRERAGHGDCPAVADTCPAITNAERGQPAGGAEHSRADHTGEQLPGV